MAHQPFLCFKCSNIFPFCPWCRMEGARSSADSSTASGQTKQRHAKEYCLTFEVPLPILGAPSPTPEHVYWHHCHHTKQGQLWCWQRCQGHWSQDRDCSSKPILTLGLPFLNQHQKYHPRKLPMPQDAHTGSLDAPAQLKARLEAFFGPDMPEKELEDLSVLPWSSDSCPLHRLCLSLSQNLYLTLNEQKLPLPFVTLG